MAVKADMNGAVLRLFIVPDILSADGMLIGGEVVTFLPMDGAAGQADFCRKAAKASAEAAFARVTSCGDFYACTLKCAKYGFAAACFDNGFFTAVDNSDVEFLRVFCTLFT